MSKKRTEKESKEKWWSEKEEEDDEEEEDDAGERVLDENDLTQLPGVDKLLAKKLNREGYTSLWDIAYADAEYLVDVEGISRTIAKKMIVAAKELIEFEA